jgi:polyhydroxybutyrate depolymerase
MKASGRIIAVFLMLASTALVSVFVVAAIRMGDEQPEPATLAFDLSTSIAGLREVERSFDAPLTPPSTPLSLEGVRPCDTSAQVAGDHHETIRSGDLDRTYILHLPPQYDVLRRLPLVLNLHGYGSNARNQAAYSRLPQKADEAGFIVVSPDGAGTPQQWNNLQLDYVAFISELLDHLEATLCIDPARIYAVGISNGAAFAQRLACLLPDRIAGVAAIAAFVYPAPVCGSKPPVPIIAFHGTADPCVPYEGGVTACGRGNLPVPPVETSAENWARHDGCSLEPARSQVTEHVQAIAYSECNDDAAVVLYAVEGGGHTWPGSIDVPRLGAVTAEIDATDLLWEFFEAHP